MNKILVGTLLFCLKVGAFAQTFIPFPTGTSVIWHDYSDFAVCCDNQGNPAYYHYDRVFSLGNKFEQNGLFYDSVFVNTNNGMETDNGYYGGFRQDSIHAGYYFIRFDKNEEDTIFDLNLKVGEKLKSTWYGLNNDTSYSVSKIDTIEILSIKRFRYEIVSSYNPWMPDYFIEGIGTDKAGIFTDWSMFSGSTITSRLNCVNSDIGLIYADGNQNQNCSITDIEKRGSNISTIFVYPNPSTGKINLCKEAIAFKLYNALGELILQKDKAELSTNNAIDLEIKTTGIYYYRIALKDGDLKNGKIIIESAK